MELSDKKLFYNKRIQNKDELYTDEVNLIKMNDFYLVNIS